ncbi:MAG: hypothetical protein CM15mP84_05740 [Cellvibrionales bacterium]|nr:MAG: hypothetical protein CM15mP84_05740 [Cellvibrionales bacterium]
MGRPEPEAVKYLLEIAVRNMAPVGLLQPMTVTRVSACGAFIRCRGSRRWVRK